MGADGTIHHEKVRHLMTPSVEKTFDHVVDVCSTKRKSCFLYTFLKI